MTPGGQRDQGIVLKLPPFPDFPGVLIPYLTNQRTRPPPIIRRWSPGGTRHPLQRVNGPNRVTCPGTATKLRQDHRGMAYQEGSANSNEAFGSKSTCPKIDVHATIEESVAWRQVSLDLPERVQIKRPLRLVDQRPKPLHLGNTPKGQPHGLCIRGCPQDLLGTTQLTLIDEEASAHEMGWL